jgi:two-component system phosphate regulon sensor histidine kinase PhoR
MGMKSPRSNRASDDAPLLSSPQIYSMLVNNLPIGFSLVDRDGIILEFNPAAEKLAGYSKEEVIGKSHFEIIHGSKNPDSCPLFKEVLQQQVPSIAAEMVLKKKNGELITVLVVAFPLFDTSGNFIGGAELFRDISEQKRLERERKNLLSMFAHDMKNPVVAAGGFLTRLLSGKAGPLMEKQKDYLAITIQAIAKLQQLISDFLEFSRLEQKEYKPALSPCNLEEALLRQIEMTKMAAEKREIQICFEYTQEDLPVVYADAAMIDRVLSNLIGNAIKYTNPGGTVTIRLTGRDEDILVEVLDTGIGIHEQDIPCVFDAFCRVNRDVDGTGLGLSIAKAIVEAHHGIISVESTSGKGSRFWFTLPKNIR